MYPATNIGPRSRRVNTDSELASFYAGTQFRSFREITLAAGASLVLKMTRPVDVIIRGFRMHVSDGEMRCDIYRDAVPGGSWVSDQPVIPKCEFADRPPPIYTSQCTFASGGTFTGGTLYDVMRVKTAGASGQAATVGDENDNQLGIPANSVGIYLFSNPGNASASCIWDIWFEELPTK